MFILTTWTAGGWRLGIGSHTVLSSMMESHSSYNQMAVPGEPLAQLKLLPKAAHRLALPPTYVPWLGTLCPCQTVTSCSQKPQLLSSTHTLLFPAGGAFSLPIPIKFWGQHQPAFSGERAIHQWLFLDPWHRDQQGHYIPFMCLPGFFPSQWALRQDSVPGSLNPHSG